MDVAAQLVPPQERHAFVTDRRSATTLIHERFVRSPFKMNARAIEPLSESKVFPSRVQLGASTFAAIIESLWPCTESKPSTNFARAPRQHLGLFKGNHRSRAWD